MARERTATKGSRLWVRGQVNILEQSSSHLLAEVHGDHGVYLVKLDREEASCQCPWFMFKGSEKPCSHIEAVRNELNGISA